MRPLHLMFMALVTTAAIVAAAFLTACGSNSTAMGGSTAAGASGGAVVGLGATDLGQVLVDAQGKTLYLWAHDTSNKSTCSGDCAEYWPPLLTQGKPEADAGADSSLLGTSRRGDGAMQ